MSNGYIHTYILVVVYIIVQLIGAQSRTIHHIRQVAENLVPQVDARRPANRFHHATITYVKHYPSASRYAQCWHNLQCAYEYVTNIELKYFVLLRLHSQKVHKARNKKNVLTPDNLRCRTILIDMIMLHSFHNRQRWYTYFLSHPKTKQNLTNAFHSSRQVPGLPTRPHIPSR